MSTSTDFGFGKFVPGFDFLQNLAKGASQAMPQMPSLSNWVAPTLNVEELDKRISELKAVHFWLEQNGKALAATIQALEVQKMTLATLQGMNFNMGEVADALKARTADTMAGMQKMTEAASGAAAPPAEPQAAKPAKARPRAETEAGSEGTAAAAGPAVDPLQWWGALTQQFQEIAAHAMQDVAGKTAPVATRKARAAPAAGAARQAATGKAAPRKAAARKGASKR